MDQANAVTKRETFDVETLATGEWAPTQPLDLLIDDARDPSRGTEYHARRRYDELRDRGIICRIVKREIEVRTTVLETSPLGAAWPRPVTSGPGIKL